MVFVKTAKQDRPDVALVHLTAARELDRCVAKLIERPRMVHAIDLRGIQKPLDVLAQAEDGWPTFGCVTANALKDTGTVMEHVRHHVNARVVPFNKLSVMPHDVANARRFYIFSDSFF